jgi:lysophospholipase L1-like esterase
MANIMKKILALLVCLLIIQSILIAQSIPGFWPDIVAFKKIDSTQKPNLHSILFVGSSSFTKWKDVQDYFPDYPIINRGFGGSTLVDVIRYSYDIILPYQPKQVLIYCGENDLASQENISSEEVLLRVKTLFNIIRTNLPDATIDYVSIKPSPVRASIQDRVKIANKLIMAYFKKQKNAGFIDIYEAMLDSKGNMREELYLGDRLHMKPEGYAIWKKAIAPYLVK